MENIFETLYKRAEKVGKESFGTPYYSRTGDYGSKKEYTIHTFRDGGFTLVATKQEWKSWGPTSDNSGQIRQLEIFRGKLLLLLATIDDWKDRERFSFPCSSGLPSMNDERYLGKQSSMSNGWKIVKGVLPKKYKDKQ